MDTYGPVVVGVASVLGGLALAAFVFWLVRRITARLISELESEGIERRSGSRRIRIRFRNFRSERFVASHRISIKYGELVLVQRAFVVVVGVLLVRFADADLRAAEVWVEGERLCFESTRPTDATGTVTFSVALPEPEVWRDLLIARGARLRAA